MLQCSEGMAAIPFLALLKPCVAGIVRAWEEFDIRWNKLMQNQATQTPDEKRAALAALEQAFEYWSGDVLKPSASDHYEDVPQAA